MFRLYILIIFLIFSFFFCNLQKNIEYLFFDNTLHHCALWHFCLLLLLLFPPWRATLNHCSYLPPSLSPSPLLHFESRAACLFVKTFFALRGLGLCASAAAAAAAPPGRHLFIINSSCKLQNVYSGANTRRPLLICSLFRCLFVLR